MSEVDYDKIRTIVNKAAQDAVKIMPTSKIKGIAKEASKEAVAEMAAMWGMDVENPLELQKDFAHSRKAREGSEDRVKQAYGWGFRGLALLIVAFVGSNLDKIGHVFK